MFDYIMDYSEDTPGFTDTLLAMISKKGVERSLVWKAACLDKRYFSKILCNKGHIPIKKTVIALGLALKLDIDDFEKLLKAAGYALAPGNKFDMAIKICVENHVFNIVEEINPFLKRNKLPIFVLKKDEKGISKISRRRSSRRRLSESSSGNYLQK